VGKHESGYERVEKDLYPTPPWVTEALGEHIDLTDLEIWEPAAGNGQMAEALKAAGATVHATDICPYDYPLDKVLDFTSGMHRAKRFDGIITNPPYGQRNKLAEEFVEVGLRHIARDGGFLALLLPTDFDSAKTRSHLFRDCPYFAGKVVLTRRIKWFEPPPGERKKSPKENHTWYAWGRSVLRGRHPAVLYAPVGRGRQPLLAMPTDATLRERVS
jgi:predicted RNA methylase